MTLLFNTNLGFFPQFRKQSSLEPVLSMLTKSYRPRNQLPQPVLNNHLSKFSELKLIEIVILWVYYTMPYDFSLFRHFLGITF